MKHRTVSIQVIGGSVQERNRDFYDAIATEFIGTWFDMDAGDYSVII